MFFSIFWVYFTHTLYNLSQLSKLYTAQPYNAIEWEIKVHPVFWRVLKENPHYQKSGKEINLMWDLICDRLPNKPLGEEKKKLWSGFRAIYSLVESLFNHNFRSDWTPYFYHLLETAFILLEESWLEEINIEDIFVALLHDVIEDTSQDYNSLWRALSVKWKEIAFWVHIISKPPFHSHMEWNDLETYKNCLYKIGEENIDLSWNIIDENIIDESIVRQYNEYKKTYKPLRNQKHFENYTDFKTFFEYAKQEAINLWIPYKDEWLEKVCIRSVNVKLADRLHNLRTLWHMSETRVIKKIQETRKYILWIADEVNPSMAEKIRSEITKLEWPIIKNMFNTVSFTVRGKTNWLIA